MSGEGIRTELEEMAKQIESDKQAQLGLEKKEDDGSVDSVLQSKMEEWEAEKNRLLKTIDNERMATKRVSQESNEKIGLLQTKMDKVMEAIEKDAARKQSTPSVPKLKVDFFEDGDGEFDPTPVLGAVDSKLQKAIDGLDSRYKNKIAKLEAQLNATTNQTAKQQQVDALLGSDERYPAAQRVLGKCTDYIIETYRGRVDNFAHLCQKIKDDRDFNNNFAKQFPGINVDLVLNAIDDAATMRHAEQVLAHIAGATRGINTASPIPDGKLPNLGGYGTIDTQSGTNDIVDKFDEKFDYDDVVDLSPQAMAEIEKALGKRGRR